MNQSIIFIALTLVSLIFFGQAAAQDCPKGLVNDPYPGSCGRYVDTNGDGYCDHSQDMVALEAANENRDDKITGSNFQGQSGEALLVGQNTSAVNNGSKSVAAGQGAGAGNSSVKIAPQYYMLPIFLVLLTTYLLSAWAAKTKKISVLAQRRAWNLILLILFAFTALTSVILLLRIDCRIGSPWPVDIAYWHIEFGWAMIVVSFLHILWRAAYFKGYFKKTS